MSEQLIGYGLTLEWTTRALEREYVTQEGDQVQLRVDGLAVWRGGLVVDFIKYKEPPNDAKRVVVPHPR